MEKLPDGHANVTASDFSELPIQIGPVDNSATKQVAELSMAKAIQSFMLAEAKSKAEVAELQKRLIIQQFRPCNLYPTIIYHDRLRWVCGHMSSKSQFCEYEGTDAVAYGMSPEEAMHNFDKQWLGNTDEGSMDEDEDEDDDEGEDDENL